MAHDELVAAIHKALRGFPDMHMSTPKPAQNRVLVQVNRYDELHDHWDPVCGISIRADQVVVLTLVQERRYYSFCALQGIAGKKRLRLQRGPDCARTLQRYVRTLIERFEDYMNGGNLTTDPGTEAIDQSSRK